MIEGNNERHLKLPSWHFQKPGKFLLYLHKKLKNGGRMEKKIYGSTPDEMSS